MSFPLSVQLLFLGGLLQVCSLLCIAKEYYVTPTQPSKFTCPTGKPCHTLGEYATNSSWLFHGKEEVSLLFGSGIHDLTVYWTMSNITNLTMVGLNSSSILDSPKITCQGNDAIYFAFIMSLKMEYLTFTCEDRLSDILIYNVQNIFSGHILTQQSSHKIYSDDQLFNYQQLNSVHRNVKFLLFSRTGSVSIQDSIFTDNSFLQIFSDIECSSTLTCLLRNISYYGNSNNAIISSKNIFQSLANLTIDNCHFEENVVNPSILLIRSSSVYFKGNTTFANNIGVQGGAMNVFSSYFYLEEDLNITFINNSAIDVGGAIYIDDINYISFYDVDNCFYKLPKYSIVGNVSLFFINNSATNGGADIYGTSLKSWCRVNDNILSSFQIQQQIFHFIDKPGQDLSQVASKQERVCLCDERGRPQCANFSYIVQKKTLTPGEKFNVSVAIVGGDFGTLPGSVYTIIKEPSGYFLGREKINVQYIRSPVCTSLEYSVHSLGNRVSLFIGIDSTQMTIDNSSLIYSIYYYYSEGYIEDDLRVTPVQINIDILACPLALTINNSSYKCECNSTLTDNGIDHCIVNNSKGLVYRNETTWIGLSKTNDSTELLFSHDCPYNYCKIDNIPVDLNDSDFQCELGHVGILCGSCPSDLSLALGSSQCLNCTNDGGLALVIGFVIAGTALVFLIKMLDLTVSRGTINGLIFYANIIWINRNILFLSNGLEARSLSHNYRYSSYSGIENSTTQLVGDRYAGALTTFKVFVAWLNLDFGIESCFFRGLNAYWKTWLQFVFPLYLWIIVLIIIVLCRYSSKLTKVFGNNIVSVLATLFLMSYIKLLRTIVTVLGFSVLYSPVGSRYVWLFDGTVSYFGWPHSILFVTALLVLTILILPYTLTLLCVPYLKRKSDYYLLRWINKFKPILDVYYGPLKDKYHSWIGVTLLIRVFLALLNETNQTIPSNITLAINTSISAIMSVLVTRVYKSIYLSVLESFFLMNLTLLCISYLTTSDPKSTITLVCVSIGVSFLTFLGIVVFHGYTKIKKCQKSNSQGDYQRVNAQREQQFTMVTCEACNNTILRDDALRETLLDDVPTY